MILTGVEVGDIKTRWHAADYSEWRRQVELYNHRYVALPLPEKPDHLKPSWR